MKKQLIIPCFLLVTWSLQAQVKMYYEKHLTGKMDISDIAAIQVSNYPGVDIDYIYKGWVTDEEGKEVLRIQSNVLTQSRGPINYYQNDKFDSWKKGNLNYKILNQSIDLSSYSGQLTLHSDLVHPLDTTSIIAREMKAIFLKNGMYTTIDGVPLTDPRLVGFDFGRRYEEKFNLDSLFSKMNFNNQNEAECCLPLRFEMMQGSDTIYAASTELFCIPPGKHKMDSAQIEALNVAVNNYENRDKNTPIKVAYRLGDSSGSRDISNIAHSDFNLSFDRFTHHASGLSFDFINHAEVASPFIASSFALIFDEKESLEKMEMLNRPGNAAKEVLGLYHPFHCTLQREDLNGSILISTFQKDNLSEAQWKALLGYVNNIDKASLLSFEYEDIRIFAPRKLLNPRKPGAYKRVFKGYAFLIIDQDRATIFGANYFSVPPDMSRKFVRDSLDIKKVLESIAYNGIQLGFNFENGELKDLGFNSDKVLSRAQRKENFDKMRRYHYMIKEWPNERGQNFYQQGKPDFEKLDRIIAADRITKRSAIPAYVVITPEEVKHLKYETFSWDSIGIQLSYRAEKKSREMTSNRTEEYDYTEKYKIETSAYISSGANFSYRSGNPPKNTDDKNVFSFSSNVLEIRPGGQLIELSRLNGAPEDAEWLKAIVKFQNLAKRDDPVGCKVLKVQNWTFYVPDKKLEKTRWQKESICFIADSGKQIYRIKLSIPSVFDKQFILNSLQIEGKQLQFDFKGDLLENISIQ